MKNNLLILTLLVSAYSFSQKVFTEVEQISEFESYHSNLLVNDDSTVIYTQYFADYHIYEEFHGAITKIKKHEFRLNLKLSKSLKINKRSAANQLFFIIEKDSSFLEDFVISVWDFTEETIPFELEIAKKTTKLDTVIPVTANNPAMIYTPYWNPTNKDEIVQRINWNATPIWKIYSQPQGNFTATIYIDEDYFEILNPPKQVK